MRMPEYGIYENVQDNTFNVLNRAAAAAARALPRACSVAAWREEAKALAAAGWHSRK